MSRKHFVEMISPAPDADELISRYCEGMEDRIRSAGSRGQAETLVAEINALAAVHNP